MNDLADLYRRKLNLPDAVFTYIDHEDAMVAAFQMEKYAESSTGLLAREALLKMISVLWNLANGLQTNRQIP